MLLKNLAIIVYNDLYIGERPVEESGTTAPFFSGKTMIRSWTMNVTQVNAVGVISKIKLLTKCLLLLKTLTWSL